MVTSSLVYPIHQFGRIGKIHSVFGQSFNIKIQDQLIHIGSYRQYISSFGVYIDRNAYEDLKPHLQVGNGVRVTEAELSIYSTIGVVIIDKDEEQIDLQVNAIPYKQETVNKLYNILGELSDKLQIGLEIDSDFKKVQRLLTSEELSEDGWTKVIKYMIGRGQGLTPSGDDMMLAYLFIMTLFSPERAKALSLALTKKPLSTTDVSNAYVLSCVKGYVSSPIHALYQLILEDVAQEELRASLSNIMNIGHTSGRDMVYGIKMGIDYLMNT